MKLYTTFSAAEIIGVTYSTISRWIDAGKLKGFKTVGGHRKITEKELKKFMKARSIPMDGLYTDAYIVVTDPLFVDAAKNVAEQLEYISHEIKVELIEDVFYLGAICSQKEVICILTTSKNMVPEKYKKCPVLVFKKVIKEDQVIEAINNFEEEENINGSC